MPLSSITTPPTPTKAVKHAAVAQSLRHQIQSGALKPGDRLPSYTEARAQFGTHTVTLEKAYTELEREGLIIRERGRGTFVATKAPRKKKSKVATGIVGIAGFGFEFVSQSSYWAQLLDALNGTAREAGHQIILLGYETTQGWEKADGLIICDWTQHRSLDLVPAGMPLVSLLVPVEGIESVVADDFGGAKLATQHLIALGHRRIAFLCSEDDVVVPLRRAGWLAALKEAGILADPRWEKVMECEVNYGASFAQAGRDNMAEWMAHDWNELGCTALLAHNDHTALGAIEAFRQVGKQVPEDVSVVGFDDSEICDYSSPRLSSVAVPLTQIGRKAMELLLRQLSGTPQTPKQYQFSTTFRSRDSSGPVKQASREVTLASSKDSK